MKQVPTRFTAYELTAEEGKLGATLTSLNVAAIQTMIANIASDKLMLVFDPSNPQAYVQDEAYKRGQLDILQHLLDLHEMAINPVVFPD